MIYIYKLDFLQPYPLLKVYNFSPDYNWEKYRDLYETVCGNEDLVWTDTMIFGLGDDIRHSEFNRGVTGNYRVCISDWLGDC